MLEGGHPAEAAELAGGPVHAASVQHGHDSGDSSETPWHVAHCGSHCAGHAAAQPPVVTAAEAFAAPETWILPVARHLTSQAPPVQDRPPRT